MLIVADTVGNPLCRVQDLDGAEKQTHRRPANPYTLRLLPSCSSPLRRRARLCDRRTTAATIAPAMRCGRRAGCTRSGPSPATRPRRTCCSTSTTWPGLNDYLWYDLRTKRFTVV